MQSFQVEFPDMDACFTVDPGQSIAQAAALHGVEIPTGCEDGKCGTCVVRVVAGEVEHLDHVLSQEKRDQGWMCACVSRARSHKLILEIW